jgi:hypothetical protein
MPRITIEGLAAVSRNDEQVTDPGVLASLVPLTYGDELFTTYMGGTPLEDAVREALEPGGVLRFTHAPGTELLTVRVEFEARRILSPEELRTLIDDTLSQWSDGIGENWTCESPNRTGGYAIMCLFPGCGPLPSPYPVVRIDDR